MLNHSAATLDLVFAALMDPTRRGIIERLTLGPASVSQLAEPLSMSLAAVVQHVQHLQGCGLIRTEKIGRVRTCTLVPSALRSAERWIAERRTLWERRLARLDQILSAPSRKSPKKP